MLSYDLSFYNKNVLLFIVLLLLFLLEYPFNFIKIKEHFSLQRNALTLLNLQLVQQNFQIV